MMRLLYAVWCIAVLCLLPLSRVQGQDVSDFVESEVDHTTAYVGEPILYTWHWYLRDANTADLDTQVQRPTFDGFGQEVFDPVTEPAIRNGQTYQVITQQIVLYPRREGSYALDPLRVVIPETPFTPAKTLESPPTQVTIRALPANAPATFGNAVGQFDLVAQLDPLTAQTGTPLTFTMTITGSGNTPLIYTPTLTLGPEWRMYPGESRTRRDGTLLGTRIFTWQIVPLQPGMLTLPSQSWSYLNPQTGQYETRATEPFAVTVAGDPIVESQAAVAEPTLYPLHYGILGRDSALAPGTIWLDTHGPRVIYPRSGLSGEGSLLALIAPAVASGFGIVALIRNRRRGGSPVAAQKAKRRSKSQDRLTALTQKPPQDVALSVQAVLRDALSQKYSVPFTEDLVQSLPIDLRGQVESCFDVAKAAPYAPFTSEDAKHLIRDAQRIIRTLETL